MARKTNANLTRAAAAAVLVVVAGGFWLHTRQEDHKADAQKAAAWMIAGPACPAPAAGAARPELSHTLTFEEVGIAREVAGSAACETIRENGDGAPLKICQFLNPGALKATTSKGTYSFAPPAGRDASLVIRDDVPACVLHVNPALFR